MIDKRWLARIPKRWRARQTLTPQRLVCWILLVAAAYVLAGRMGQLLAFPPNYATAVWPPSGIALAAVLLLGRRAWPGIFLGALIINGWTPWCDASSTWIAVKQLVVPVSISVGATAQALLGGYLIGRIVGFPNPLIHDHQILNFLALGGPVACLLGPTWGVATLAIAGKIQGLATLALNWWTWWMGDVIGVILFTPLLLIAFARPRKFWRPRWASVSLPLTAAIAVTVFGFVVAQRFEERQAETHFKRIANNADQLLNSQIEGHLHVIDSLQRYFAFAQFINQAEFSDFTQDASRYCRAIKVVAWVARERTERGEKVSQDALTTDQFTVTYRYPQSTPFASFGNDFPSEWNWQETMESCCDTGNRVASPPFFAKGSGPNQNRHVLVLAPVYLRGMKPKTAIQRRQSLTGFLAGVIEIDALVHSSSPQQDRGAFQVGIVDVTEPDSPSVVQETGKVPTPHKSSEVVPMLRRDVHAHSTLSFSGRTWACRYVPTAKFYIGQDSQNQWILLSSGLAMTAVLGTFLLVLSGRTARIETSEARYLDLYENAPDMFISLDVGSQRVIECNRTFLDSTGFQKDQVIDKHMYGLLDPDTHTEARRAFRDFLRTGHVSDVEMRLLCHDGSKIDISMKMSAVRDENGESIVCRAATP